jgi:hypothetical protein
MPKYTTRKKAAAKRQRKTIGKSISKDKRILKRWAAQGSVADYAKLRRYVAKYAPKAPDYVNKEALQQLATTDRRRMVESLHNDGGAVQADNEFIDALAWVAHVMPGWPWSTDLFKNSMEGFKGDSISEQDEDYAKLLSATYMDDRPEVVEHWQRLPQYDSEYVSLWVNQDGHAYIAVRGTKVTSGKDLLSDAEILVSGTVPGQSEIVPEIQHILRDLSPDVTVDAGAHSLGTTLLLKAYEQEPSIKRRIRQSFIYNPASTPLTAFVPNFLNAHSSTEDFIDDKTVRYFINLADPVSAGFLGDSHIANVVYRTGSALSPMTSHSIDGWYAGDYASLDTKQVAVEQNEVDNQRYPQGPAGFPDDDSRYTVNFGADDWDSQFHDMFSGATGGKGPPTAATQWLPDAPPGKHSDTTAPSHSDMRGSVSSGRGPAKVDLPYVREFESHGR